MDGWSILTAIDAVARELALFACVGLLIGGIDDLALDAIYAWRGRRGGDLSVADAVPVRRLAVFVPVWEEAHVIGAMLRRAVAKFAHPDYRLYVGCYPNDAATVRAVAAVAADDPRVRLVVNPRLGPTTKGDNLNALWRALRRDERAAGDSDGWRADAVILHDAEDVVHPGELAVIDAMLADHAAVQLPVRPLIAPARGRWVSGSYADEFAEVHNRALGVRQALGAALPLAGVGCAIRRDALDGMSARRGGAPFDESSLVEDYELGLAVTAHGGGCFARAVDADGRSICVQALFPTTVAAAARQKARWMAGIALIGWDRIGWTRADRSGGGWRGRVDLAEWWMRLRDRRAPVAALILAAAYAALLLGMVSAAWHMAVGMAPPRPAAGLGYLLAINSVLLLWRLATRMLATGRRYGWREGLLAAPRTIVANTIALLAARRALAIYLDHLRGGPARWDKTAHAFPDAMRV